MSDVRESSINVPGITRTTSRPDSAGWVTIPALTTFSTFEAISITDWASFALTVTNAGPAAPGPKASIKVSKPSRLVLPSSTTRAPGIPNFIPKAGTIRAPKRMRPSARTRPGRRNDAPVQRAQRPSATMSGSFLPRATRTLSPIATRTAGSKVNADNATAITERIIPRAIVWNTMTGTRNTAARERTTVNADKNTALPDVAMVFSIAASASLPSSRSSR